MSADPAATRPSSRRALLAGAIGAVAASVASAISRPAPASAVGAPVYIDQGNASSAVTYIETSAPIPDVFIGSHLGSGRGLFGYSGGGTGVRGESGGTAGTGVIGHATAGSGVTYGVYGQSHSTSGYGVYGHATAATGSTRGVSGRADSSFGFGVHGESGGTGVLGQGGASGVLGIVESPIGDGVGVSGITFSASGVGVRGHAGTGKGFATPGTAVMGYSGLGADPAPVPKTGVYGYADQDANARGVWGRSTSGRGVFGQASSGTGVRGYATSGTALYGSTSGLKTGTALRAVGRVKLDNCAGIATINGGNTSVTVTPGIDLLATSAVTATLQGNAGGTTTVQRVAVDATNDTFTIYLTANSAANVKVAWHVFG